MSSEKAAVYASLILHDAQVDLTVSFSLNHAGFAFCFYDAELLLCECANLRFVVSHMSTNA